MTVYIASHKHCQLVIPSGYKPLFVGAARQEELEREDGWLYDDQGESISEKNDTFCETTGLYWAWKHPDDDAIAGLVHYRRYFKDDETDEVLSAEKAAALLESHDCIATLRYAFEWKGYQLDIARHYRIFHSSMDLRIVRDIIRKEHPDYLEAFDIIMQRTWLLPCNMLICKRNLFDRYCEFLFSILESAERKIDPYANRPAYQTRVFGFLAERLLNVFIEKHGLNVKELPNFDPIGGHADGTPSFFVTPLRPKAPFRARIFRPKKDGIDFSPVFDACFYINQYPDEANGCNRSAAAMFDFFLAKGLDEGHCAHPDFSIESYRTAHPELVEALDNDSLALCLHYLESRSEERFAFGYENFDFTGSDQPTHSRRPEHSIAGTPISDTEIEAAHTEALKQGAIG